MISDFGFDNTYIPRDSHCCHGHWFIKATFDSGDMLYVNDYIADTTDEQALRLKKTMDNLLKPYTE